jgi:uncharacterized membrane protein YjgN (DUF898 family)
LRNLFLATTLIATVICAAVNYPVVLIVSLCIMSPFIFTAVMAYFATNIPVVERSLLFAVCMAVLLAGIFGCIVMVFDGR